MKDRQPTQVLANGAIRYGFYNADGTLNHYEYLKRDDAPTEEGTPLNKANLLSDATAAKIWPGAATRPEDPTVNDALFKLAKGTSEVGDITITARTDLSSAWLPCDGRTVSQEQYPSLCAVLRTPDSPAIWTEKTVSTNIGAGGDALSYENGHWFRTYRDATSAHILVSDDGETWTEWAMPQNFWLNSTILSTRVVAAHAVKYCGGMYVCSVLVLCAKSSEVSYYRGVLFASDVFGQFRIDAPDRQVWYNSYSKIADDFAGTTNDVYWDGQRFFVLGTQQDSYNRYAVIRYTNQLTSKSGPAESDDQAWTGGGLTNDIPLGMYVRKTDGMIMILCMYGSGTEYSTNVYYTKNVAGNLSKVSITGTERADEKFGNFVEFNGAVYICDIDYGRTYKITGADALTSALMSDVSAFNYGTVCAGQIVAVYQHVTNQKKIKITEDIEQGWDYTVPLSTAAGNQPVAAGTIVRIPCSSNGAVVKDIMHNFAYDNKKIPNITTDARSKAYIKALEE